MARIAHGMVVFALALTAVGCSRDPRRQLQGKWIGWRAENFSPAQAANAEGFVSAMTLEFKGTRVAVSIPAESPREGAFEVAKAHEGTLTLAFVRPTGARDTAEFRLEDERLRWQLGDGRSVLFRKADD